MTKRKAISKKTRFEVFKRDSFTCQYCGRSAPEVILHLEHINPVAGGGDNDVMNLITSCEPCNQGKGARALDDNSIIAKQKAQLDELNARREQLEMMVQWREALRSLDDETVNKLEELFSHLTGRVFSESGRAKVKSWLRRYSFAELYEAMEASAQTYWKDPEDEEEQSAQAGKVFEYTTRIIAAQKRNADKPWMKDLFYVRAIVRNRHYCNERVAIELIERAFELGAHIEELKDWAKQARNWTNWRSEMEAWIEELERPSESD